LNNLKMHLMENFLFLLCEFSQKERFKSKDFKIKKLKYEFFNNKIAAEKV